MSEVERLDALVVWMRKRGVVALTSGDATISLATLQDPADIEAAVKARAEQESKLTPAERAQRERDERAQRWYGPTVRRKGED